MNNQTQEHGKIETCGNCRFFSTPVVGDPVCALPDFLIPPGTPEMMIKAGKVVKQQDHCIFWAGQ